MSSRYYDPEIGRWVNEDFTFDNNPIVGVNLYTYCLNSPENRRDIHGYLSIDLTNPARDRIIFEINLSDEDIRAIKFTITSSMIVFDAICAIIGVAGGIPSLGITTLAAAIAGIVVSTICGLILAYIDYKDYGKGAKLEVYVQYGFYNVYYPIWGKSWWGWYIKSWESYEVWYSFFYKIPRLTWNK